MRDFATTLHDTLKELLGRIRAFDLTDAQIEDIDALILMAPPLVETSDRALVNVHVALYELIRGWEDWKQSLPIVRNSGARSSAGQRMVDLSHQMEQALAPPIWRLLESPFDLLDQKCNPRQIAEALEWKTPDGEPDVHRVSEELAKGRANAQPTRVEKLSIDLSAKYEDALLGWTRLMDRKAHDRKQVEAARPTATETLDELIAQKVSVSQIAYMSRDGLGCGKRNLTEEEVEARAKQLGMVIPGMRSLLMEAPERETDDDRLAKLRKIFAASKGFKAKASDAENVATLLKANLSAAEIEEAFKIQTGRAPSLTEIAGYMEGAMA